MTPYEIMLSESQERMLLVVKQRPRGRGRGDLREVGSARRAHRRGHRRRPAAREGSRRGRRRDSQPALTDEAPVYDRPTATPGVSRRGRSSSTSQRSVACRRRRRRAPGAARVADHREQALDLPPVRPHGAHQHDRASPGMGAGVVRVKGTDAGAGDVGRRQRPLLLSRSARGAMLAVAEAARNVACAGALPIGATNCLNFGNPERPEIMWQFAEAVAGIGEACRALDIPITGGNVSLYNETDGRADLSDAGHRRRRPDRGRRRASLDAAFQEAGDDDRAARRRSRRARRQRVPEGDARSACEGMPPALDLRASARCSAAGPALAAAAAAVGARLLGRRPRGDARRVLLRHRRHRRRRAMSPRSAVRGRRRSTAPRRSSASRRRASSCRRRRRERATRCCGWRPRLACRPAVIGAHRRIAASRWRSTGTLGASIVRGRRSRATRRGIERDRAACVDGTSVRVVRRRRSSTDARQVQRRVRRLRHLRAPRGRQPHLPRPLRAAAPRPGERRHRHLRRRASCASRARWATSPTASTRRRSPTLPGHIAIGHVALLDRRREQARERAADPHRLRARPDRHRPQRQPRQRAGAARRAGPRGFDLPDRAATPRSSLHLYARSQGADASKRRSSSRSRRSRGAFSLVLLTKDRLIAARDPHGFRPLALGRLGDACDRLLRDLRARPDRRDLRPRRRAGRGADHQRRRPALDQAVPAARRSRTASSSTSTSRGPTATSSAERQRSAHRPRPHARARGSRVDADVVVPIPDSGVCAAIGFAEEVGPADADGADPQSLRRPHVHPAAAVDPPLRREGEAQSGAEHPRRQARRPGRRLDRARHDQPEDRQDGARRRARSEVHLRISCPPTISPCFYGVDTPSRVRADRARRTRIEEIREYLEADSLAYLSLDGLRRGGRRATSSRYCTSCYTGVYPVAFPRNEQAYLQLALSSSTEHCMRRLDPCCRRRDTRARRSSRLGADHRSRRLAQRRLLRSRSARASEPARTAGDCRAQLQAAIDKLGDLDFPTRTDAGRTVRARRTRHGRAGAARRPSRAHATVRAVPRAGAALRLQRSAHARCDGRRR